MSRRRTLWVSLGLFVVIAVVGFLWWNYPALSSTERQLLGSWTAPASVMGGSFVTKKGPVKHPELVWEFRRDRSFRVRVISADDPTISIPFREGLWSAEGGKLNLDGFEATGDALRELRERIRVKLGGSYVGRTSGRMTHTIRFITRDSWELTPAAGPTSIWNRRP